MANQVVDMSSVRADHVFGKQVEFGDEFRWKRDQIKVSPSNCVYAATELILISKSEKEFLMPLTFSYAELSIIRALKAQLIKRAPEAPD